jgi:hypothetical protein
VIKSIALVAPIAVLPVVGSALLDGMVIWVMVKMPVMLVE